MHPQTKLQTIIPVLPSSNIERDITWYDEKIDFRSVFHDNMYAVLNREDLYIHLQWHADTEDDPLLGGWVIRIFVKNIQLLFKEMVQKGLVKESKFPKPNTVLSPYRPLFFYLAVAKPLHVSNISSL